MNRQSEARSSSVHTSRDRNRKREHREVREPINPLVGLLRGAGLGILSGTVIGALLLLLSAGIAVAQSDPDQLIYPAALLVLGVSSLLCGVFASRISSAAFLPTGLVTAGAWLILTLLASLIIGDGAGSFPSVYAMAFRIPQAFLVLLGAFLGKNRPRRAKPRRRQR